MLDDLKKRIRQDMGAIPSGYRTDRVIRELIRCVIYGYVKEMGLTPIPDFRVPRYPEGPVDIAALDNKNNVKIAFASAPTVELDHVKSMGRIEAERKIIITFSEHESKVKQSAFFLNKDIEHLHLHAD